MFSPDADLTLYNKVNEYVTKYQLGCVSVLRNYPNDGKHIQINIHGTNLIIKYGLDPYYFNSTDYTKRKYWYIDYKDDLISHHHYRSFEKAIKDSLKIRKNLLRKELKEIKEQQSLLNELLKTISL